MAGKVLDLDELVGKDALAEAISAKYMEWEGYRQHWLNSREEVSRYIFATDTSSTLDYSNPEWSWKNKTTVPKLTQIRDNLHANYMAALFPNANWLVWEGDSEQDETEAKRDAVEAYMRTKLRQDRAETTISQLLLDYIDYGNCFATAEWVDESSTNEAGQTIRGYVGPRIVRISPLDIVFNPVTARFADSPKILRGIFSLGELKKRAKDLPADSEEAKLYNHALERTARARAATLSATRGTKVKSSGYQIDGFSSIEHYYGTDYVDVLVFHGDLYDVQTDELLENHIITVIDRRFVVSKRINPNWTTHPGFFHAGWRQRPDNLYSMGPLDNLVGMQYRIDHLENLKADVFDLIAHPVFKIVGETQDFVYEPGAKIYVGEDGDVGMINPDVTALNADTQIFELERRMEEMAGAPKQAMGIRTPGEKTKYEVQVLDNAASRIFLNKTQHFEKVFLEPLLNYMLQLARRNMSASDVVRTLDSEIDAVIFSTITRDDITANGILRPRGASHFAQQANALQNLTNLMNSALGQDPAVNVHWSGKRIARLVEELSELDDHAIYSENARIFEQAETQRLMNTEGENVEIESQTAPGLLESDPESAIG